MNNHHLNTALFVANRSFALSQSRLSLMNYLKDIGWVVVAVASSDSYSIRLIDCGIIFIDINFNRYGVKFEREYRTILKLINVINKFKPKLIHQFNLKPIAIGSFVGRFISDAKLVNTITGLGYAIDSGYYKRLLLFTTYRLTLRMGHMTIFQNTDDMELFVREGIVKTEESRIIKSSGIRTKNFTPKKELPPNRPIKVLMIARLLVQKGVKEFLEAAELCKTVRPNGAVSFQIAGESDPTHPDSVPIEYLQPYVDRGVVEYLGYLSDPAKVLRSVDIFVSPSYREGMPRTNLEAAACGVPVITTDVAGCRESILNEVTGLLVPPRNADALAASILALMDDSNRRAQMGQRGREWVTKEFDESVVTSRHLEVYRELGLPL